MIVDAGLDGWPTAVASQAKACLDAKTWSRLFRGRKNRDCKLLAQTAQAILQGKKQLHEGASRVAARLARDLLGVEPLEEAVVRELAARIPIPVIDQQAIAVARGMQVIGIAMCLTNEIPMNRCQCFVDLSLVESREIIEAVVEGALDDWTSPTSPTITAWTMTKMPR
ncbi:MAG: hypothetical protein WAL50_15925 [Kineosporiaceae bacterium]